MASSELSTSDHLDRRVTLRRVDEIDPTATVRHVDQLEPDEREQFYELWANGGSMPIGETDFELELELEVGEIIVFTDYVVVDGV
ncbi:hypothetical protein [Halobiforma nitratireducens]|uniref:DUF7979 domain-containing protein n=1 Tax=Halobiforma nitratireducens JCM 10879 TaxID=1227454 RepID=M0M9S6_9EURY|nr:hypothetical protein [Halobiforma nitratireducens]EMA41160.1 hypothetical protein C446_06370 [Halobiforma nitratireducens JCM 10879]